MASGARDAYIRLRTPHGDRLLFLLDGKVLAAGAFEAGRVSGAPLGWWAGSLVGATEASLGVCDRPLLLAIAAIFRKPPAASASASRIGPREVLMVIEPTKEAPAAMVIRSADAFSVLWCERGAPSRLYAAEGESFPSQGSLAEQVATFTRGKEDVVLDLYPEVEMQPAAEASSIETLVSPAEGQAGPYQFLLIRLGARVVFHHAITSDRVTVGRGSGNDLSLDSATVSRSHAEIVRLDAEHLLVKDLDSANGVRTGGSRVAEARLGLGDEVELGIYALRYERFDSQADAPGRNVIPFEGAAKVSTMLLHYDSPPEVEFDGHRHPVKGAILTIGSGSGAWFQIKGDGIAPIHATILRDDSDGSFSVLHVDGQEPVVLNAIAVTAAKLRDGDEIRVAGHVFRFHVPAGK